MTTAEESLCGICQDSLSGDQCEVKLTCTHRYHFSCLQEAYEWSSRCPLCRAQTVPNFLALHPAYISLPATPALIRQLAYMNESEETEDEHEEDPTNTPASPERTQMEENQ